MNTLVLAPEIFATEGGISRILRLYIRALAENISRDSKIEILALKDKPDDTKRLTELTENNLTQIRGYSNNKLSFSVSALVVGAKSDIILCGHLHQLVIAWAAKRIRPSISYYLVAHGIEVWRPFSWAERLSLRGAEKILCVSEYTRRQILRFEPALDPNRLVLLPNTFDPRFSPGIGHQSHSLKVKFHPKILVVSRLSAGDPFKGVDLMIEALPRVQLSHPDAQLRIVGDGSDRQRLEEIVAKRNLGASVHFCGHVDDDRLSFEYQQCDIFGLPSRKEGFGLVYLEAMSYGKPCIAARSGGAPEVVDDAVGALVDYGNTEQIAVAISDLIRRPRKLEAVVARAQQFSYEPFKLRLSTLLNRSL
jgi:phosphatidylinositol alpha-1,6-mannosyltransferase